MRYDLRTLLIWAAIGPLIIALTYWAAEFALGGQLRWQLYVTYLAVSLYGCLAMWRGLNQTLFGPTPAQSWRRKTRRRFRFRLGRLSGEST